MQNIITMLFIAWTATAAFAFSRPAPDKEVINQMCPISEDAIDGKTFADYDGHRIGFCCAGCDSKFLAWDKNKKDAFVKKSLASQDLNTDASETDKPAAEIKKPAPFEPYTLDTCPVSKEKLGSMGDPVALKVDGREVKLCCKSCISNFSYDKAKYMAVVDKGMAAQQIPYYPLDTCLISGEPLVENGESVAVDVLVGNRLFRVCCESCVKKVKKDPGKYLAVLDAAVIKAQLKDYPLKTCIVREKSKLGSMGDPVQRVVGNRLVQFCCDGCIQKFEKDPTSRLAKLDAEWVKVRAAKQAEMKAEKGEKPKDPSEGHDHEDHDH